MRLSSGVHEHRYEIVYRSHFIIVKENLLHYMFRDKDKLISPMSMYTWLDYKRMCILGIL